MVRHEDVSVVLSHDVPLMRHYGVYCKSQITPTNNVVVRLHHVSELRCRDAF